MLPVRVPRCDLRPPSQFNGFGTYGIRKEYRVRARLLCVHNCCNQYFANNGRLPPADGIGAFSNSKVRASGLP